MSEIKSRPHFKVTLKPSGEVVEVEEGKNLLSCLREQNIYIKSSCGGHATCSDCIVKVVSGEDYITPPPFNELKLLGNVFHITKERLACQLCVTGGDISIDISKHDKASDEEKLKGKTSQFAKKKQVQTLVKKESDRKKELADKEQKRAQFDRDQKNQGDSWQKHWEKDKSTAPKRLQGGKRPKFFDTDKVDYEKKDFTRPLPAHKAEQRKEQKREEHLVNEEKTIPASDKDFKKFRG